MRGNYEDELTFEEMQMDEEMRWDEGEFWSDMVREERGND